MKQIKDYPNYLITTDGRIFNLKKMKFLKKLLNNSGYYHTCLYNENGGKFFLVHRIMAETFLPKDDTRNFVNHIDGNKENNLLCNLEWCTHQENMQHAWKSGLSKTSEKQRQNGRNTIHIALKAANELKRKKIIDISNGKIYNSSKEAAFELGYKKETLANWLNGHRENKTNLKYL